MFNIADIIVIALILVAVFLGYKKGFIKTFFGVLSFFIAIAITFIFYKPVMNIIKEKTGFESWLTEYLYSMNLDKEESNTYGTLDTESGETYINNLPQNVIDMMGIAEIKENVKTTVTQKVVYFAEKLLAIIIVYVATRIILIILVAILNSIAKLPILKQFNEILGLILGGILGILRVYVICAIVTLIGSLPAMAGIAGLINNSLIASIFYNNNILLKILF